MNRERFVSTFSIIGFDPDTKEWGIAVQSKFLGVGSVVPWAKANVGAVATQSFANTTFGPKGLELLENGFSPEEAVAKLIEDDEERALRQFAIIDAAGRTAVFTGDGCYDWAGHRQGTYCTAQGNILVGEETVNALIETFERTAGTLAERLLAALDEAQKAGGDSRGKQSASLYVVQHKGGYGGYNDRKYDLRVDDHPEPINELIRLYELHQLYFSRPNEDDLLKLEGEVLYDIQLLLLEEGVLSSIQETYNDHVKQGLKTLFMKGNFEERWREDDKIDPNVLQYMKGKRKS